MHSIGCALSPKTPLRLCQYTPLKLCEHFRYDPAQKSWDRPLANSMTSLCKPKGLQRGMLFPGDSREEAGDHVSPERRNYIPSLQTFKN